MHGVGREGGRDRDGAREGWRDGVREAWREGRDGGREERGWGRMTVLSHSTPIFPNAHLPSGSRGMSHVEACPHTLLFAAASNMWP